MSILVLALLCLYVMVAALVLVVPALFVYFAVRRTRPPQVVWLAIIPWAMLIGGGWVLWRSSLDDALTHNAAVGDDAEVTRLLARGVDPNHGSFDGSLALVAAARAGDTAMITLLVRAGADVNRAERVGEETSTPLQAACSMMLELDTTYLGRDAGRPCAHADAAAQLRRLGAR